MLTKLCATVGLAAVLASPAQGFSQSLNVVPATDKAKVKSKGKWSTSRFRFAAKAALQTNEDNASLTFQFKGRGIAARLGGHNVPAYGKPNLGRLAIFIDGKLRRVLRPRALPREVVLADQLASGRHTLRVQHRTDVGKTGVRIESLASWQTPRGELRFQVNGQSEAHLVDCRAILRNDQTVVRNALVRNWLTGQCSLAGLPAGEKYTLEVRATGWRTMKTASFSIQANKVTRIPPIFLQRESATVISRFRFPRVNQPAIRQPGETFRARFLGFQAKIEGIRLIRRVGPAVVSRQIPFQEDKSRAYYYDREVVASLPRTIPPGLYDLEVKVNGGRRTGVCRSPRSVHIVSRYPDNPRLLTFGHLDTSAQYQGEYLQRLASVANLLAADLVLCSNGCNPAYVSGALSRLQMPYVINFGNHQFPGHEAWFGDPVGLIDVGPNICILNYGYPWHTERVTPQADSLLSRRPKAKIKIINAFEANASLKLLDKHRVQMIHDAHGIGKKVTDLGSTPTRRIGKSNSESFRVVQFRNGKVESCTYNGAEVAPVPFRRGAPTPVAVSFRHPNDGSRPSNTATIINRLLDSYPNGRVTFVMPKGRYHVRGGRLESQTTSDDRRYVIVTLRVDIPAKKSIQVSVTQA